MALLNKIDLQEDEWVDQVFLGRNHQYGAYVLRTTYTRNVLTAVGIAILASVLILLVPKALAIINNSHQEVVIADVTKLAPPPPVDKQAPPPPPPKTPPPPPVKTTIKFTPPVVKRDEEVKKEDIPPPVSETKKVDIGAATVKGDDKAVDIPEETPKAAAAGEDPNKIFVSVEQNPQYPGGDGALMGDLNKYLQNHYPPVAKENNIQGRVTVNFVVERDGSVTAVTVLRGQELGGGLAEAAVAAVHRLKRFTPGRQNGNAVRVSYSVPVTFHLEGGE